MMFSRWSWAGGILLAQNGVSAGHEIQQLLALPLFRDIFAICLIALLVGTAAVTGVAWYIVETLTRPKRRDQFVPVDPYTLGLPAQVIAFPCRGGAHAVRGLYIPAPGATSTVLVCPGYRRSLTDVLAMCKHIWEAGHTVLAFEYYGHGTPVGVRVTLGYRETDDFLGAIAYAKERAPATRLGAIAYSMGAASAIMACARTKWVEALVADSGFATEWSAVEVALSRTLGVNLPPWITTGLYHLTDLLLWWRAGHHFSQVQPVREIGRIAPCPVFIIHGLADTVVDPRDAVRLYHAAAAPRKLWLIPKAKHARGYFADAPGYTAQVTAFFEQHLKRLPPPAICTAEWVRDSRNGARAATGEPSPSDECPRQATRMGTNTTTRSQHLGTVYGALLYRYRWLVISLWLVALMLSLPFAGSLAGILHNSGYAITGSESAHVDTILKATLHRPVSQVLVLFQSDEAAASPHYQQEVQGFLARVRGFPHVTSAAQGGVGQHGQATFVTIGFDADQDTVAEQLPALRALLPTGTGQPARAIVTGEPAIVHEIQAATQTDAERAELLALPLTLLVLLVVFGTAVAGLMPLFLAVVAVPVALALIYAVAVHVETNIFVLNIASIIGLGLSIDYSLLIVRRFREELARGRSGREAVAWTVATAGEAVAFSGLAVIAGFAALFFIGIPVTSAFALGGITVASTAVLAALTLLPALLCVLGTRINALRLPLYRLAGHEGAEERKRVPKNRHSFWQVWAALVMRRPWLSIALVIVVLAALATPARILHPDLPGALALPPDSEARAGLDEILAQFPEVNIDPIEVIVQTPDGSAVLTPQNLGRLQSLSQQIAALPHVASITGLMAPPKSPGLMALTPRQWLSLYSSGAYRRFPDLAQMVGALTQGNTTLISVRSATGSDSQADQALIDRLRALDRQPGLGLKVLVGGPRALALDFDRTLYGNFVRALLFMLIATYVLLLLMFRSLILPLKAIIMNMLSIGAAYGVLVFIFQEGHFQTLLHFSTDGSIDRFVPVLLFCVLFGLSMDYEVFLLARIQEEWRRTGENRAAVAYGLQRTGGVITNAALLFIIVSASFATTSLVVTKELGLGITVAVLLDASIIRSVLVPATMQVLGRWNWWFPGARRKEQQLATTTGGAEL